MHVTSVKHDTATMPDHRNNLCIQDELKVEQFPIEENMHHVPASDLFDFMANKLVSFAERIGKT